MSKMLSFPEIKTKNISIMWFRRDLRHEDNTALLKALSENSQVMPLFIFDTNILSTLKKDDRRISFIYGALKQLFEFFRNAGSGILVLYGKPSEIFKQLIKHYSVKSVYFNHDYEPYALQRDDEIENLLKSHGIPVISFKDQVIFEKTEILKADGQAYSVYTPYSKKWIEKFFGRKDIFQQKHKHLQNLLKTDILKLPPLEAAGFKYLSGIYYPPVIHENLIYDYETTRNFPALNGTSGLSPHLRFGTISIRKLAEIAMRINKTWLGELIWREFFMMIVWHYPRVVHSSFKKPYDQIEWVHDESAFEKWKNGMTGYPMVDAGMRELIATGLMHNRVRMITASFLTKHLLTDWRRGEAYFAEQLLDYELSSNNGNWQWAAGSGCDAAPYFRIFNPEIQTKKFDPDLRYIKKWVPEYNTPAYPLPMIEHQFARQRAIAAYKKALQS